jgi:hypothetical protein
VRVPIRAQVICVVGTDTLRGVTSNISQSGIQVEIPELKTGANLQLTFRLPRSESIIDVRGAVVWQKVRRHGIKFKYMGERSQQSIRHFIAQRTAGGA